MKDINVFDWQLETEDLGNLYKIRVGREDYDKWERWFLSEVNTNFDSFIAKQWVSCVFDLPPPSTPRKKWRDSTQLGQCVLLDKIFTGNKKS